MCRSLSPRTATIVLLLMSSSPLAAQTPPPTTSAPAPPPPASSAPPAQTAPAISERVEVVATRVPESPDSVPASVEVITADELRDLGVQDLRSALSLAAGITIAPGGDNGPASAVPEFLGLKESDAFLLVVDGVPWGGAFNPALAALSLSDVERIEVLRGPAPVTYGATSFVGVIHVVHKQASSAERAASFHGGAYGSWGAAFASRVPFLPRWDSRLSVDVDRRGFSDPRTSFGRGHALWRNAAGWGAAGHVWFDLDALWLNQDPASPSPRDGTVLSPLVPIDANQNPAGAFLHDRRVALMAGVDRPAAGGTWTTSGSVARDNQDTLRGYLLTLADVPDNARGFREQVHLTDAYLDSHLAWQLRPGTRLVAGGDVLHGLGNARGADFDYQPPVDGSVTVQAQIPVALDRRIEDRREFAGAYLMGEWNPTSRLRVNAGLRVNVTSEARDAGSAAVQDTGEENTRTTVRPSGTVGVMWTGWQQGADRVAVFADYRNTFKPAAFDFGIGEAEGDAERLLEPETSGNYEAGLKSRAWNGRLSVEVTAFLMDFANLVIAQAVNGLPALANAGTERFKGVEGALAWYLPHHVTGRATWSLHGARFRDYVTEFDGVPTQLAGKRIEMSARDLGSFGLIYSPPLGVFAGLDLDYVGSRYLDKRNRALAGGYATVGGWAGFRAGRCEARLEGSNLSNQRRPISESELGDAQYYRVPARRIDATLSVRF